MSLAHGLIWKLSFDRGRFSYLYGTIHISSAFFTSHRPQILKLMESCSVFAAEVDLDQINAMLPEQSFHLPGNNEWPKLVRSKVYQKMAQRCKHRFGIDLNLYNNTFPVLLSYMLTFELTKMSPKSNVDQQLWDMSKDLDLERTGLESLANHFDVLKKMEVNDQIKMLKELIFNEKKSRRKLKTMISKYENEELQSIYKISKEMLGKYKRLMLYDRNKEMTQSILTIGDSANSFFSCGAAHLAGEFGILRSLKKHGIGIQHVSF